MTRENQRLLTSKNDAIRLEKKIILPSKNHNVKKEQHENKDKRHLLNLLKGFLVGFVNVCVIGDALLVSDDIEVSAGSQDLLRSFTGWVVIRRWFKPAVAKRTFTGTVGLGGGITVGLGIVTGTIDLVSPFTLTMAKLKKRIGDVQDSAYLSSCNIDNANDSESSSESNLPHSSKRMDENQEISDEFF